MAEENKDERIESLEEKVIHLSRMLVKSFAYADQDPDTFLQNARRTTEAICRFLYIKEIGEPKGKMMLNDYGRELVTKKIVPDRIGILIGTIQTYGNYAAHAQDDLSETTRAWIAPCQTALANLTNWFFLDYLKGNIPDELSSTLSNYSDSTAQESRGSSAKKSKSKALGYVLATVVVVGGAIGFYFYQQRTPASPANKAGQDNSPNDLPKPQDNPIEKLNEATPDPNAKRIAIIYFDSPDDNVELTRLRKGLADMLISDLSKVKMLNVVERSRLEEILKEQKLNNSKQFDQSTATKLGKLLGVEYILTGSYFEMIGKLRIDARIIQVETGKIVKSEGVDGDTPTFFELEKNLVGKIASGLQVDLPVTTGVNNTSQSLTYKESLVYSEGLEQMDKGDVNKAMVIFEKILATHPDFAPAKQAVAKLKNKAV